MYSIRHLLVPVCLILFHTQLNAASIPLQNLTTENMKQVVGDLSLESLHTTVSGAGTLGSIFGFEIGVVGGTASTPHLQDMVSSDPSADASNIPYAQLIGAITVPYGLTAEVGYLPKVGTADFKAGSFSLAAKWTATEIFSDLPLDLAAKLSYTKTSVSFNQTVSAVPISYGYDNTQTALTILASKSFSIVEPYIGIGYDKASGKLTASSSSVFAAGVASAGSATADKSGNFWLIGTEVKLLAVKLGAEWTSMYAANRIVGKISIFF